MTKNLLLLVTMLLSGVQNVVAQNNTRVDSSNKFDVHVVQQDGVTTDDAGNDIEFSTVEITVTPQEFEEPVREKIKDTKLAIDYLNHVKDGHKKINKAAEVIVQQVTPETDGQQAIEKMDHALISAYHKLDGAFAVVLPAEVMDALTKATQELMFETAKELRETPVLNAREYLMMLKGLSAAIIERAFDVLEDYYDLTDADHEAIVVAYFEDSFGSMPEIDVKEALEHAETQDDEQEAEQEESEEPAQAVVAATK